MTTNNIQEKKKRMVTNFCLSCKQEKEYSIQPLQKKEV